MISAVPLAGVNVCHINGCCCGTAAADAAAPLGAGVRIYGWYSKFLSG